MFGDHEDPPVTKTQLSWPLIITIMIAVISKVPYLTDKGERPALYKINKNVIHSVHVYIKASNIVMI